MMTTRLTRAGPPASLARTAPTRATAAGLKKKTTTSTRGFTRSSRSVLSSHRPRPPTGTRTQKSTHTPSGHMSSLPSAAMGGGCPIAATQPQSRPRSTGSPTRRSLMNGPGRSAQGISTSWLGVGQPWIAVHASTYTCVRNLAENTHIESALVPHETARALIVAIQTSSLGPDIGHFPTSDEFDPFDEGAADHPYTLTPWLDASGHHDAIDKDDERGRDVPYPPTRPTESLVERFGLEPDRDMRKWVTKDLKEVFRSHIWSNTVSRRNDYETGTSGQVLSGQRRVPEPGPQGTRQVSDHPSSAPARSAPVVLRAKEDG